MPKFLPGAKVVCIDASNAINLRIGNIYYVHSVFTDNAENIEEVILMNLNSRYSSSRFVHSEEKPNTVDEGLLTTASKNDKDKVDLSLIPAVSMREHAKAFMVGEKKYNRYNYCKGHKASQLVAAAMRHLTAWFEREEYDPIDGQHHLGSVMACCSMILRQQELNTLKDDRYEDNRKK